MPHMHSVENHVGIFNTVETRREAEDPAQTPLFFAIHVLEEPAQIRAYLKAAAQSQYIADTCLYSKKFHGISIDPETEVGETIISFLYAESPYSRTQYWLERSLEEEDPNLCNIKELQSLKERSAIWNNQATRWAQALAEVFPQYNEGASSVGVTNEPVLDQNQFLAASKFVRLSPPVDYHDVVRRNAHSYFAFLLSNLASQ